MANPKPRFPYFVDSPGKLRYNPARYIRYPGLRGWHQDGRKLHDAKASKAFIWPKDGRNGSRWGRMKDIFNNEGPDMYVAFGANKSECVSNRPRKSQWAGHHRLDEPHQPFSFNSSKYSPWTRDSMLGGRDKSKRYDFRTREYTDPSLDMWTDAVWQPEPYGNSKWNCYPQAMRDYFGDWHQDLQYLPWEFNGLVDNEFGRDWRFL